MPSPRLTNIPCLSQCHQVTAQFEVRTTCTFSKYSKSTEMWEEEAVWNLHNALITASRALVKEFVIAYTLTKNLYDSVNCGKRLSGICLEPTSGRNKLPSSYRRRKQGCGFGVGVGRNFRWSRSRYIFTDSD
jgi:hypothetical protein